ncbi:MAG: AAA family ATPase [Acidimicrobiia bacterium]|nr:AAA family ATPase [Acidimicrobiia bacterium]
MTESSGQIIILNGTASSGKSSIAKELQRSLPGYTLHTGIDHFAQTLPEDFVVLGDGIDPAAVEGLLWVTTDDGERVTEFRLGPKAVQLKESMYRSAQAAAGTGFNVIVDDVIMDERVLAIIGRLLAGKAYFVGVRCPKDVASRRHEERGDRFPGLVETQFDIVHSHGVYDLTVDTHANSSVECADAILEMVGKVPHPGALKVLDRRFTGGE